MGYSQIGSMEPHDAPVLLSHSLFRSQSFIEVFGRLTFLYHCQSVVTRLQHSFTNVDRWFSFYILPFTLVLFSPTCCLFWCLFSRRPQSATAPSSADKIQACSKSRPQQKPIILSTTEPLNSTPNRLRSQIFRQQSTVLGPWICLLGVCIMAT